MRFISESAVVGADLGWRNVGWRNPEAQTPAIDALRAGGVTLERAYTYRYCSPTRSALLSGRFAHHVNQYNWDATSQVSTLTEGHLGTLPRL